MANVVYLLGAGFSAPLGLPLIRNFLEKSKDQYESDPKRFTHFESVFETIRKISYATGTYVMDLNNIEEILSVLEMDGFAGQVEHSKLFTDYISDVINHYTPPLREQALGQMWQSNVLPASPWDGYCLFLLFCQGIKLKQDGHDIKQQTGYRFESQAPPHNYSFITLNYDLVMETSARYMSTRHKVSISLSRPGDKATVQGAAQLRLAKLHGSVDTKTIVPPTWSKGALQHRIAGEWTLAHQLLSKAHHIRIVGYSLPEMDSYVRYLLRSAAVNSFYLKQIDVLCFDPDGAVKKRFDSFIHFPNYRFTNRTVESFFQGLLQHHDRSFPEEIDSTQIERAHVRAML